jgi:hypothetical protein
MKEKDFTSELDSLALKKSFDFTWKVILIEVYREVISVTFHKCCF